MPEFPTATRSSVVRRTSMTRIYTAILVCLSSLGRLSGMETTEPKLPPAAAAAVEALQRDIGKNYAAYHAAVEKASERAAKDLQRAVSDATKKGDLDTATAIKAVLDDLNAGTLQERLKAIESRDIDLLGEAPPPEDALKALLAKGDWILERSGKRNLLHFETWEKAAADANAHWTCTVEPDVQITLQSGIRLTFSSKSLAVDTEFVCDPKTSKLTAPNSWVIRHPTSTEELPPALNANPDGPAKIRARKR